MRGKSWHNSDTIVETKGQQTFFYEGPDSKYFRIPGFLLLLKQESCHGQYAGKKKKKCVYVSIKLYSQNQAMSQIWPLAYNLTIVGLN